MVLALVGVGEEGFGLVGDGLRVDECTQGLADAFEGVFVAVLGKC